MSRLGSIEKGGYFPFPDQHLPALAGLFKPAGDGGRLLDPCAGEGRALKHLADAWGMTPYANEIDEGAAALCRDLFGWPQTVCGDLNTLRTTAASYPVIWCNPPYTQEMSGNEKRREFSYMKVSWQWLQPGGLMLWAIYAHHFSREAALWLGKRTDILEVWRVPGLHLDTYSQVVVVARQGTPPPDWQDSALALMQRVQAGDMPALTPQDARFSLPPQRPVRNFTFAPSEVTPEYMADALTQKGVHLSKAFTMLCEPEPIHQQVQPIVQPRGGQLGLMIAAGMLNGLILTDEQGKRFALRSIVEKVDDIIEREVLESGKVRETIRAAPKTTTSLLYESGKLDRVEGDEPLLKFIRAYKPALLKYIEKHFKPLYDFTWDDHLRTILAYPFRGKLYDTQKHVIAATVKAFQSKRAVLLSGEPGSGKTIMGATVAAALQRQMGPDQVIVVMAPPHLVPKWERELALAYPLTFIQSIATVDDVAAFMDKAAKHTPKTLKVAVLSRERAKLGEGWEPAVTWRKQYHRDEKGAFTLEVPSCPVCGCAVPDSDEYTPKEWLSRAPRRCENCKSALWQLKRTFSAPKPGEKLRNPRVGLAEWIAKRYPGRVYLYIADEVHELKGDTDQGEALMNLANAATKTLGMTGTLYGGTASSLHRLELIFNPRVRHLYPLSKANEWVHAMGVLERVVEHKDDAGKAGTYNTKAKIVQTPREVPGCSPRLVGEIIDHAIFVGLNDMGRAMPNYTELPMEVPPDTDVRREYYRAEDTLKSYLLECMRSGDNSALGMYLQAMLSWPSAPYRTEDCTHHILMQDGKRQSLVVHTLPGLGEDRIYAKEQWLIDVVQDELASKRGVAIFVRQSGLRDIQPRIVQILKQNIKRARPYILYSATPPEKREEVINNQVLSGTNILICNPKIVQTGLDLLAFPTIIFYEIDYSLYVTMQASRRAWRLTQNRPCVTYYPYYDGFMEERAIRLVGQKQAAAAMLYGEESGGLSSLTSGGGTLMKQLAKEIGEIAAPTTSLQTLFNRPDMMHHTDSAWHTAESDRAFSVQLTKPKPTLPTSTLIGTQTSLF